MVYDEPHRLAARYMRRESPGPRKAQIVEMKFFSGLTTDEVAEVLKITSRTVEREWRKAKAWLNRAISKGAINEA